MKHDLAAFLLLMRLMLASFFGAQAIASLSGQHLLGQDNFAFQFGVFPPLVILLFWMKLVLLCGVFRRTSYLIATIISFVLAGLSIWPTLHIYSGLTWAISGGIAFVLFAFRQHDKILSLGQYVVDRHVIIKSPHSPLPVNEYARHGADHR